MSKNWIKVLFVIAAIYDLVLGAAFLFFETTVFRVGGVSLPNHPAYVQFPALLLIIFAAMFFRVAADPIRNRDLILYGAALKVSYCGVVFWHMLHAGIPALFTPWAWADIAFLALFLLAWTQTGEATT